MQFEIKTSYRDSIGWRYARLFLELGQWHECTINFKEPSSPMHLHVPETLSSILWCPTLVGPYHISYNRLGNPNSSYASIRWLNYFSSISTYFVPSKSSKVILNKFRVEYFTIWAILTHMTFCPTCIANSMFELDKGALYLYFGLLGISSPFVCMGASCGLLERSSSCTGLDRSDRYGTTGLTGLVRPHFCGQQWTICPNFLHPWHILFSRSPFWFLDNWASSSDLIWQFLA